MPFELLKKLCSQTNIGNGKRDNRLLPIMDSKQLLSNSYCQSKLNELAKLTSVTHEQFNTYYIVPISNFAAWVQQLPASETHHHAEPCGLLHHCLDVATNALRKRRGFLLPQGADSEILEKEEPLWTYAIFTAALLHDIGKPVVDQRITLFDNNRCQIGVWDPLSGPMMGKFYYADFVRDRIHRLHERIPPLIAHFILPSSALKWLGSNQQVLSLWLASITGDNENAGVIGEIITQADRVSVARNLGASDLSRIPTTRTKPLHEKLLTGLRYILANNNEKLNANGATGWIYGDDVWLVSKRIVDSLREHLLHEGHDGIPSQNSRIFDVLQEHGVLIPFENRAIWTCRVVGASYTHKLTLIRIPLARIWPQVEARPSPFNGTVIPLDKEDNPIPQEQINNQANHVMDNGSIDSPAKPATDQLTHSETTILDDYIQEKNYGDQFITWLKEGLQSGSIKYNDRNSKIHIVPEGVFLVSPNIFRSFAASELGDKEKWSTVQKRFQKLRLHEKTSNGTNIHEYTVEGTRKRSVLKGMLISDSTIIFQEEVPSPNPHLCKIVA